MLLRRFIKSDKISNTKMNKKVNNYKKLLNAAINKAIIIYIYIYTIEFS